jgi:hypothetical protein
MKNIFNYGKFNQSINFMPIIFFIRILREYFQILQETISLEHFTLKKEMRLRRSLITILSECILKFRETIRHYLQKFKSTMVHDGFFKFYFAHAHWCSKFIIRHKAAVVIVLEFLDPSK